NMGVARQPFTATDEIGAQYSRADAGLFHLRGYLGDTAPDHLKHLYAMHLMLGQANTLLDSVITSVDETESEPEGFLLRQNYPNPFNSATTIEFVIPVGTGHAPSLLKVFDVLGREVITLVDEVRSAGRSSVMFDASDLPSGAYFYRLTTNDRSATRKLQLIR
ncbi:MAG: T9SS type A sorting domain-containing protein, partial [Ignavibacteriae bacterium]|nr:T9SS type A sorting domain-containing protein [Ignavibacteriota bacterium]